MNNDKPMAIGWVDWLGINGEPAEELVFTLDGPVGDRHAGRVRQLSGHDGDYMRTSSLVKGATVLNWRSWTAVSREDMHVTAGILKDEIPAGSLLENIIVSEIPNFSKIVPGSRLVFPRQELNGLYAQAILGVWEENEPCMVVGKRVEELNDRPGQARDFVRAAQHHRGIMGFVLSAGKIRRHDQVRVYPPLAYGT